MNTLSLLTTLVKFKLEFLSVIRLTSLVDASNCRDVEGVGVVVCFAAGLVCGWFRCVLDRGETVSPISSVIMSPCCDIGTGWCCLGNW